MERLAADLAEYHLMEVGKKTETRYSYINVITGTSDHKIDWRTVKCEQKTRAIFLRITFYTILFTGSDK